MRQMNTIVSCYKSFDCIPLVEICKFDNRFDTEMTPQFMEKNYFLQK